MTFHTTFDTTADSLALPSQSQLPERRTSPLASGRSSQAKEVCNKHIFGIGVRGGGGGTRWASATLEFFKWPLWGKTASNICAKSLDFRASAGENIRARDL